MIGFGSTATGAAADSDARCLALLVDDDCVFARRLGKALQDRGFDTEIYNTVSDAIDALGLRRFDIVITDLRIGDRSGLDIVAEVRDISPETKTLVLTGYGNVQSAVTAVRLGATEFLSKPADADEILEVLGVANALKLSSGDAIKSAELVRWEHVTSVFAETGNNVSATARLLNMHRRTLQRMLSRGRPEKISV
jgi:two-component system response regulator RegA